ncbi:TetR/AcrR family transcriptional regulator [Hoyosella altamirensis]|uniref:AcrR family transcriptional regulator n=1 Tax=Hoyosella altamirensis TaxID=616997 RepID=A0A839RUN6_9ACTN|nr:TetR/AcrR family transcriptional regulator [Hoyosella altamirensis]MBB3039774.1 AcrR family transcriptional regulator [Hoyosella altamirensis]
MTVPTVRTRLAAEDRRRQLIGIGLRLLVNRPIHELAIDEVAAEAGISRGLLFHYFPTKREYYIAVVRAAGNRLLLHARAPDEGTTTERVRGIVDGFVQFIQRRRGNYVALVRAGAGGDERVLEVFSSIRARIADRVIDAMGTTEPTPQLRLVVRGWLAMAEEIAVEATPDVMQVDGIVDMLVDNLNKTVQQVAGWNEGGPQFVYTPPRD